MVKVYYHCIYICFVFLFQHCLTIKKFKSKDKMVTFELTPIYSQSDLHLSFLSLQYQHFFKTPHQKANLFQQELSKKIV